MVYYLPQLARYSAVFIQTVLGQNTLYNAGTVDTSVPFLQTSLSPKIWWKWFKDDNPIDDDGWTQVMK